jgi:nucleoside-diphosphate kinase
MERTLIIIKPEAVAKKLAGRIFSVYEDNHLDIIHAHKVLATKDVLEKHYANLKEEPYFHDVVAYMSSSEVIVAILEGENAVSVVRELNGATNPEKSKAGSIRYMYGTSLRQNAVHGSESIEAANNEISIWKNLLNYEN